jgi:cytoskeleton protein RodZ
MMSDQQQDQHAAVHSKTPIKTHNKGSGKKSSGKTQRKGELSASKKARVSKTDSQDSAVPSLGLQLKHAREALGVSVIEVGERMRLPVAIIEAMERDDFERLGAPVYARSHLTGYARLLGVPVAAVESVLQPVPPPPLMTATWVPRSHYLFDRYARRAVYLVLTASIMLPIVWLATRDQLPGHSMVVSTLDATPEQTSTARADEALSSPSPIPMPRAVRDHGTVIASLTPFYREVGRDVLPQPPALAPAPEPVQSLRIALNGPSWIEVVAHDGRRLAFALIPAGEERSFPADEVASVSIGDADAVSVQLFDEALDLTPFRRANVARFTLSSDGEVKPTSG